MFSKAQQRLLDWLKPWQRNKRRAAKLVAPLFDITWYIQSCSDLKLQKKNAFLHFMDIGWQQGRNPHPLFDTIQYLDSNEDVRRCGHNPLIHFMEIGWKKGRNCHPLFDLEWYLKTNPDVKRAGINPIIHFLAFGVKEGRSPHPLFDTIRYLDSNKDVRWAGHNPLVHFMRFGWKEGRDCHPLFDINWYLNTNPDVKAAGINPIIHFLVYGGKEGRSPHPLFDSKWYLAQNVDVAMAEVNPLVHYLKHGAAEGRDPNRFFSTLWYEKQNPDVRAANINPLLHYVIAGVSMSRNPGPFFNTDWYLDNNPLVGEAGLNPLTHFFLVGEPEGQKPSINYRPALNGANATARHFNQVLELAANEEMMKPAPVAMCGHTPLVSFVVPVFNTPPRYLDDLLTSFRHQAENSSELILSDDGSTVEETLAWLEAHASEIGLTIVWNPHNAGIAAASNAGIGQAGGTWIGLLDHDDALAPFAMSRIALALHQSPQCQFLYTDEIIADGDLQPTGYFLKPAWDPVLLSGVNYINHLSLYRRSRILEMGGFRSNFQGSQDFDLLLRYTRGLHASEIIHLPFPAYIWRRDGSSHSVKFLSAATANARRALGEHFGNLGRDMPVGPALMPDLHRVRFDQQKTQWPLISVVIPSRNALPLISRVLDGLVDKTDYPALEIIVIDNGSSDPGVLSLYETYRNGSMSFRAEISVADFNFSRSVNRGISMARGEYVLLLNNDIEIVNSDWLKEMVCCFDFDDVAIVGAKLLYPDQSLQHAGVIVGLGGYAGHWYGGRDRLFPGPMGRLLVRQSLSAVTGACMLISKACLDRVGQFDEDKFGVGYNDIDFCLRALEQRMRVVWTPFAELVHHESTTRGSDETEENIDRFNREKKNLQDRHNTGHFDDRAFNPWYSKDRSDPVCIMLENLPSPR